MRSLAVLAVAGLVLTALTGCGDTDPTGPTPRAAADTMLVAVMKRTSEIGLRRALGRHVLAQFLTESGVLGALSGLIGTSLGVSVVVGVAMVREWTPVIQPTTVVAALVIGLVTGLLAGLYPVWRASRIQPVEALRR